MKEKVDGKRTKKKGLQSVLTLYGIIEQAQNSSAIDRLLYFPSANLTVPNLLALWAAGAVVVRLRSM